MFGGIVLLLVSGLVGAFLLTRVYLLIIRGELNVKGAVYSRRATPILYWITTILAVAGLVLTLGIALVVASGLSQGLVR